MGFCASWIPAQKSAIGYGSVEPVVRIFQLPEYQLVSLWDMIKFYADGFITLINHLASLASPPEDIHGRVVNAELYLKSLSTIQEHCQLIGLDFSAMYVDSMREAVEKGDSTYAQIKQMAEILKGRIHDEAGLHLFLQIPKNKADYYDKDSLFGSDVASNFPSASFDIEEAGKCYALARSTACVYHLMRALEVPLRLLAKEIGVPEDENWNKVLNNFDKVLDALRQKMQSNSAVKPVDWKERERFYSEASALLRNVKNAWRNDVMHIEKKYTPEEAERIFNATKDFMQFLATRLSE